MLELYSDRTTQLINTLALDVIQVGTIFNLAEVNAVPCMWKPLSVFWTASRLAG